MIISCGEALIDFFTRTAADGGPAFVPYPGGSPFNVAIAVARLGVPAGFFGGLSTDLFGETLLLTLHDSGGDTKFAHRTDRPTTLAFVSLLDANPRYAFFDEGSAGRMITEADLPTLPKTVSALHFGSFSLAEEPCGVAFEALMRREHHERVISLDINVRPSLIRNRDAYLARIDRLVAMSDIVKLSEEDLAWLEPGAEFDAFADGWLRKGAKIITLTRGAAGAVAVTKNASVTIDGVAVAVADTVGAGDSFTAGMLAQLAKRKLLTKTELSGLARSQLIDVLTFAGKAAAITVSRAGANPPWLREIV